MGDQLILSTQAATDKIVISAIDANMAKLLKFAEQYFESKEDVHENNDATSQSK